MIRTALITPDKHFPIHDQKAINVVCKIIEKAKRRGIKVSLHVWGSGISLISNLHLAISMGVDWFEIPMVNLDLLSDEFKDLKTMILNKDITLNNGLGIKLTDDVKQSYPFVKNSGYKIK